LGLGAALGFAAAGAAGVVVAGAGLATFGLGAALGLAAAFGFATLGFAAALGFATLAFFGAAGFFYKTSQTSLQGSEGTTAGFFSPAGAFFANFKEPEWPAVEANIPFAVPRLIAALNCDHVSDHVTGNSGGGREGGEDT
jgi:hypothetical protein